MKRALMAFFLIGTVVIVIAGAMAIPFIYESQTLWYKIGSDKTVLRGGQLLGLLALVSLLLQILLGARGAFLQETFGVAILMAWHKTNGILLCCLAALHIVLVLVPEGIANLPLGTKNWPEMVGGVLLLVLFFQAISSLFRQQFGLIYKQWRTVHRILGYAAPCLVAGHVFFVADSFAQGLPRRALLAILVTVFAVVVAVKFAPFIEKLRGKR